MLRTPPLDLPALPLLLWSAPAGLEMILEQEGVPFLRVDDPHPLAFRAGRFVLFDGRKVAPKTVRETLSADHVAMDVDVLRREAGRDPFADLLDDRAGRTSWTLDGIEVSERVARVDRAAIRSRILARIRTAMTRAGGVWARLGAYPHPYRSAFHFRADLDEPYPEDYARFASARRPWTIARRRSSARPPMATCPPSSRTSAGSTRSLMDIITSSIGETRTIGGTSNAPARSSPRPGSSRSGSRRRRGDGRPAWIASWNASDMNTPRISASAGTTGRSSPGETGGSRRSCRCPCIRSARGCSSTPGPPSRRVGWPIT